MSGHGRAGRIMWWICRPSLGRALLCGAAAIYLGTFIGADAVTMFCAAQGARLLLRALARRSVRAEAALPMPRLRDRSTVDPLGPDGDPGFAISGRYEASDRPAPAIDREPELTLDELIAGDPGPEPDDSGPELDEPAASRSASETGADGGEAVRIAPRVDGGALSVKGKVPVGGSDAAEALRIAVAETK